MRSLFIVVIFSIVYFSGITYKTNSKKEDNKLAVPRIIAPKTSEYIESTCLITWTGDSKHKFYELQISTSSDFSTGQKYILSDTLITVNLGVPDYANKYLRVRAFKNKRKFSQWSGVITIVHGVYSTPVEEIYFGGCSGNCATCPHPCHRRLPIDNPKE
ncbi:MAG: hypothetical protein C0596_14980 [Marinilabiliales bacterium]|nr:MAG: hypothetical protein C0596_14980 [Marinilabiliales bacterium]